MLVQMSQELVDLLMPLLETKHGILHQERCLLLDDNELLEVLCVAQLVDQHEVQVVQKFLVVGPMALKPRFALVAAAGWVGS